MQPRSFSASSLKVAAGCLARYKAENVDRGARVDNEAALLGTSCHAALEAFVQGYMDTQTWQFLEYLEVQYRIGFGDTFKTSDFSGPLYDDGWDMLKNWYARTEPPNVISVEIKQSYPIPTSIGEIPFNYIMDRLDLVEEGVYRVVDYKTNRWALTPEDLHDAIQARVYALMVKIMYPEAQKIWVTFDFLRHQPVGTTFSTEDCAETWRWIKREAERIIATDDEDVPETLNSECTFCIRKATCSTLASNVSVGGIMSLSLEEQIDAYASVDFRIKALNSLKKDLARNLEEAAREQDAFELPGVNHRAAWTTKSGNRQVDSDRVAQIVGDELFSRYGGKSITIGQFDKLLKDPNVPPEKIPYLKALVFKEGGSPNLNVKPKSSFGV